MQAPIKSYDDKLVFGKHKGEKVMDVPSSYIVWLSEAGVCDVEENILDAALWDELEKSEELRLVFQDPDEGSR